MADYGDEHGRQARRENWRGAAVNSLSELGTSAVEVSATHLADMMESGRSMSIRDLLSTQEKEIAVLHETIGDLRDRIDAMLGPEPPMDDRGATQEPPPPERSELAKIIEGQTRGIRNARLSITRTLARVEL